MAAPEIEISKDGLKLSYQRYLADSAAGFLVILLVLLAISNKIPLPFVGHSLATLSENTKVFMFLLIFLLATPLGLTINGLSWFFLGWCKLHGIEFWLKSRKRCFNPFFPTKQAFRYNLLEEFFKINNEQASCTTTNNNQESEPISIYEESEQYQDYLSIFFKEMIRLEHVTGLSQFVRNVSFISSISFLVIAYELLSCSETTCITCVKSQHFMLLTILIAILSSILYSLFFILYSLFFIRELSVFENSVNCLSTLYRPWYLKGRTHLTAGTDQKDTCRLFWR